MFSSNNMYHYLFAFSIIIASSFLANRWKDTMDTNDEYELIKKYLLNDTPLYGFNKPKIWIHTKYEINARKWKSFGSRNTLDLNQNYIHATIKTIINHCGDDFNVCLIDDDTFSKLIPSWDVDLATVAEPMKTHLREIGLLQLVYFYGGMVVPNSFVCFKNLIDLYNTGVSNRTPFICENINHHYNQFRTTRNRLFMPDMYFFGANKHCPVIKSTIEYLKRRNNTPHFSSTAEFLGDTNEYWSQLVDTHKAQLIGGEMIGVKTRKGKQILIDDIMGEDYLELDADAYGIVIPHDDVLRRTKYQWFAVMSVDDILASNIVIAKYLKASIVDSTDEYVREHKRPNVVTI